MIDIFFPSLFHLLSCCLGDANRIPTGIKHLDAVFPLLTPDSKHTEEGYSSWRELYIQHISL